MAQKEERKQNPYVTSGRKSAKEHEYYLNHQEEIKQNVKNYREERKANGWKREAVYDEGAQQRSQRYHDRRKQKWIDALGGCCAVCKDTDIRHLQVDHINGEGHLEGRDRPARTSLAISQADPTKYQVLCANCHADKHWEERHKGK